MAKLRLHLEGVVRVVVDDGSDDEIDLGQCSLDLSTETYHSLEDMFERGALRVEDNMVQFQVKPLRRMRVTISADHVAELLAREMDLQGGLGLL